jgi:hypothetical protein
MKKGGSFMPRGDGTGPMGIGSMTGRGAGYCNPGNRRQFVGRGFPGFPRSRYNSELSQENEKVYLSNQEALLENQLKQVKEQLLDLNKDAE